MIKVLLDAILDIFPDPYGPKLSREERYIHVFAYVFAALGVSAFVAAVYAIALAGNRPPNELAVQEGIRQRLVFLASIAPLDALSEDPADRAIAWKEKEAALLRTEFISLETRRFLPKPSRRIARAEFRTDEGTEVRYFQLTDTESEFRRIMAVDASPWMWRLCIE